MRLCVARVGDRDIIAFNQTVMVQNPAPAEVRLVAIEEDRALVWTLSHREVDELSKPQHKGYSKCLITTRDRLAREVGEPIVFEGDYTYALKLKTNAFHKWAVESFAP